MASRAVDLIRPEVRAIEGYRVAAPPHTIKLNQNESPIELPDAIRREILERLRTLPWTRYPDPAASTALPDALKRSLGLPEGIEIATGNGSNELIQALLGAVLAPAETVALPVPTFPLYRQFAQILAASVVEVPLEPNLTCNAGRLAEAAAQAGARVVVLARPNNPTGTAIPLDGIERILTGTDALVVVDEAYGEFASGSVLPLLGEHDRLVVLRTFSKAFRCAGLRIGYLMATAAFIEQIAKVLPPFNTSVFSREVALTIVRNLHLLRPGIDAAVAERDRMIESLARIRGIAPIPSKANFICFRTDMPPRIVFNRLLERAILVRDVSGYPLLDDCLRVSVGTPTENRAFVTALTEIMEER